VTLHYSLLKQFFNLSPATLLLFTLCALVPIKLFAPISSTNSKLNFSMRHHYNHPFLQLSLSSFFNSKWFLKIFCELLLVRPFHAGGTTFHFSIRAFKILTNFILLTLYVQVLALRQLCASTFNVCCLVASDYVLLQDLNYMFFCYFLTKYLI